MFTEHWLRITRKKPLAPIIKHETFNSRAQAVICTGLENDLSPEQAAQLMQKLHLKIPRKAFVEIVSCDCTDNQHTDELK